jgi:tetratricopeptide (TPR) repeat protein
MPDPSRGSSPAVSLPDAVPTGGTSHLLRLIGVAILCVAVFAANLILFRVFMADLNAFEAAQELRAGHTDTALGKLEISQSYWTHEPNYYFLYANILRGMARESDHRITLLALLEEAAMAYDRAIQLNPEEGDYWFGAAKVFWWMAALDLQPKAGRTLEKLLQKALEKDPNNGRYLFLLAHHYISTGNQELASKYVRRLAGVAPEVLPRLRSNPQWSSQQENDFRDGLIANRSNTLIGVEILSTLADMAEGKGQLDEARQYIQTLINLLGDQTTPWEYMRLLKIALAQGDLDLARQAARRSVEISSDPKRTFDAIFWYYVRSNEVQEYVNELREMVKKYPGIKKHMNLLLGRAQFYLNQLDKAEASLSAYLEKNNNVNAHRYLAQIAIKQQDWSLAEAHASNILKIEPNDAAAYYMLAKSQQGRKRYLEALLNINMAIKLSKDKVSYQFDSRAWINWFMDNYQDAIADWQVAFDMNQQKYSGSLYWIAMAYQKLNNPGKAREYLELAAKYRPDDASVKRELSRLRKSGK